MQTRPGELLHEFWRRFGTLPSRQELERTYYGTLLDITDGRIAGPGAAANLAGLKPSTLRSRLERLFPEKR